jgi:hypothetical protein
MPSNQRRNTKSKNSPVGMQGFWRLLKDVRHLLVWAVGSATIPIVAGFASLYPPWPPAIVQVTALLQVVTLILVYQYLRLSSVKVINRTLFAGAVILCLVSTLYLVALSQFTFTEPISKLRFVKGFVCTKDALALYANLCPWLGDDQLREAEWESARMWTPWSITAVRVALVLLWSTSFVALSSVLGSFIVHQSNARR